MLGYGSSISEVLSCSARPLSGRAAPRVLARFAPAIGWSLGLLLLATASRGAIFTVGSVGGCTHGDLASALAAAAANGPGQDEIRLSADQVGFFQIFHQSVSLVGGYADCATAAPTGTTLLAGTINNGVLSIAADTGTFRVVDLAHLEITGGHAFYGGGIHVTGAAYVLLEDTAVYGNEASSAGGGIMVEGQYGAILILDQGSSVMSNKVLSGAGQGGGIYCTETAAASSFIGLLDAFIYDNEAAVDGGGLYLRGCDLTSYSGGALRGIVGNRAGRGGGVYAKDSSLLRFYGNRQHPATLDSNISTATPTSPGYPYGSAVRIEGTGTRLELHDSWVVGNSGAEAIGARDADSVVIDRTLSADCHDRVRCSRVANNACGLQIFNTALTLRETFLEENGPDCPVVYLNAGSRPVEIEGSVFARNFFTSTRPRIISVGSGQTRIAYSTFVDNLTDATGFSQYVLGLDPVEGAHDLTFVGNLVAETAGVLVDTYENPAMWGVYNELFDCLIVHEGTSLPPVSTGTLIQSGASPFFVDRTAHDYHLRDGSPALDLCDTFSYTPGRDIDLQVRGFDDLSTVNGSGPYDIGADERQPDILFDLFETGDLKRWSTTTP